MNQLNVSLQQTILTLSSRGWSRRQIARHLAIDHETVGRHVRLAETSKPAIVPAGSPAGRQSLCRPWAGTIETAVTAGLSAQRIFQDLVAGHGFTGGYDAVKRFVRKLVARSEPPFRRLESAPGQEVQVDFGRKRPAEHPLTGVAGTKV